MLNITRDYTDSSEDCINIQSLDRRTLTEEKSIGKILDEFDDDTNDVINSTIVNYYLVTGRDVKTFKTFRLYCKSANDPKYYEVVVNRLFNSRANLIISQDRYKRIDKAVVIYKNQKHLILEETSQKISMANYIYSELCDEKLKTFCTMNDTLLYFDYETTNVASLIELERDLDVEKMMFTSMNITINTKNLLISSYYNNLLILSFN